VVTQCSRCLEPVQWRNIRNQWKVRRIL
jgi:hypothetical protein